MSKGRNPRGRFTAKAKGFKASPPVASGAPHESGATWWGRYRDDSTRRYWGRAIHDADPAEAVRLALRVHLEFGALTDGRWPRALDPFGGVREGWLQACMECEATELYRMDPGSFRFPDDKLTHAFLLAAFARYLPAHEQLTDEQLTLKEREAEAHRRSMARYHAEMADVAAPRGKGSGRPGLDLPTDDATRRAWGMTGQPGPGESIERAAGSELEPLTLPELTRAFTDERARSERRRDDGDRIHRAGTARLAARMAGALAESESRDCESMTVQLYVDESGSMRSDGRHAHATRIAYALAHAAKLGGATCTVIGFSSKVELRAAPRQLPALIPNACGDDILHPAIDMYGPQLIGARGRRVAFVLTDGGFTRGREEASIKRMRAAGVEMYLVCIGWRPEQATWLSSLFTGCVGFMDPEQLVTRLPREILSVVTKGKGTV